MILWTFVTVLCILRTTHPSVHQPDKVITVALGNTVTLQCFSDKENIFWYKQIAGQHPQVISALQKISKPIFFNEFKNDRFSGKRLGRTSNLTISDIIQSDEAVYYCGSKAFYIEFAKGTHLIIKDSASKISEERLCPAVLGLACALGLCGVLIFALVGFIFKRVKVSGQDNQVKGAKDTDDENLTYAALQFSQRKMKSGGSREKSVNM